MGEKTEGRVRKMSCDSVVLGRRYWHYVSGDVHWAGHWRLALGRGGVGRPGPEWGPGNRVRQEDVSMVGAA